jgi:pimeloyl-ACP methyl ester carboxylesterase
MADLTPHLTSLKSTYGIPLANALQRVVLDGGDVVFEPWALAAQAGDGATEADALALLDHLAALKLVESVEAMRCPCPEEHILSTEEIQSGECSRLNAPFVDLGSGKPVKTVVFRASFPISEDVRWMVLLHGMNTRGEWQQEYTWLFAQHWGYAIPVYIYKYGKARVSVTIRHLQQRLKRGLIRRLVALQARARQRGFGERPDIIAHSFGTWLIANALRDNPDLRIRRLILVGAVVRPDFDWSPLLGKQVDAVLCHSSPNDEWVGKAHFIIPDAGPSGRIGFNNRAGVVHRVQDGFRHSDYFAEQNLEAMIKGIWGPFLTRSLEVIPKLGNTLPRETSWKQRPWPIRAGRIPWI